MLKDKKMITRIISAVVVLLVAVGLTLAYRAYVNSNVKKGIKDITVYVVVNTDNTHYDKTYKIETKEKFLGYALINNMTLVTLGDEGSRYITGVDGINADSSKEEWWKILINGEMGNLGMDQQPIKDGDEITIEFTIGFN